MYRRVRGNSVVSRQEHRGHSTALASVDSPRRSGVLGKAVPKTKREIINEVAQEFQLDAGTFLKLLAIKTGERKASSAQTLGLFKKYVAEIDALSSAVDKLPLKKEESVT